MATTDTPLQALTIFLLREIEDPLQAIRSVGRLRRVEIDAEHTVFIKRKRAQPPTWARFFEGRVDPDEFGKARSPAAVLLCRAAERYFALAFGTGRYLLDPLFVEQRFGLLVTLNAVNPAKVRSIDKASLDRQGMQSRIQASHDARPSEFGLDIEQDLVKAVAGTPMDGALGETIAGFDSLHVAARIDFDDLRSHLATYLAKSREKQYLKDFGWIDQVCEVRDTGLKAQLQRQLVKRLKERPPLECTMVPEGIIDWNQVSYFQFGTAQRAPRFSQLTLERFLEHIGGAKALTVETLERGSVRALRADDSIADEWPAERCLLAELPFDGKSYLLSSGKWYQVDEAFVRRVDAVVRSIPTCEPGLPEYRDETEGKYNIRVAEASGGRLALVDADNVRHGGGRSQIEFCDLYSQEHDLIHVKRYSGSATLSHLFSQATVSSQSFKSDSEFRRKVNTKLPRSHRIVDVTKGLRQDEYRVVIAIVGGPKSVTQLPFFSRVTLKNSYRGLLGYGFRVAVAHVPLEEQFARLASLREKANRARRKFRNQRSAGV
jgi:uncharacterized protein (TIGR04141 family)